MNTEVRDALPDLLHGRLSALDTATMKAHVESCADCRAELALLAEIRDARLMPSMNVDTIASAIAPYSGISTLVPGHERVSLVSRFGSLRIAAAAVLVAAGGWLLTMTGGQKAATTSSGHSVAATSIAPSAAASTTPAQANAAASSRVEQVAGERQVASLSLVGGTDDLSDSDLEELVSDLETIEAVPSAEPQSVTLTVDDMGIDQ